MNIGNYIHELLLENEMVIIPGFGAFISSYKPAEINQETGELKPPSKEISFNQQIRNNDGLLVGRVAECEIVSHFDALKKIEKERENIIYHLDKGERVFLEETGELFNNEKNEIQFEPVQNENLLLDSFGLETVSIEESVDIPAEAETPKVLIEPEETDIQKEKPKTEKTAIETDPVVVLKPERKVPEYEHESFDSKDQESAPEQITESDSEKKKKRSWLWLLLILGPIIIVGIYITTNKTTNENPPVKTFDDIGTTITEEPIIKSDSTVTDSIPEPSQDSSLTYKIDTSLVETVVINIPKFILVGGSFKAEENAENYLEQLKDKGFEPFHLGKRGNFYIVGIGKYNTEKEALTAKRNFNEESPNSGVWIYEEKTESKSLK